MSSDRSIVDFVDSAIRQWRCIETIVSLYGKHTLGMNSNNLQASCYRYLYRVVQKMAQS